MSILHWAAILVRPQLGSCGKLDHKLTQQLRPHFGLDRTDCAITLLGPKNHLGGRICSFLDNVLVALAREM